MATQAASPLSGVEPRLLWSTVALQEDGAALEGKLDPCAAALVRLDGREDELRAGVGRPDSADGWLSGVHGMDQVFHKPQVWAM